MSWSPQHCAGQAGSRDGLQCSSGRKYGFVVHGLWPQCERGYPESCGRGAALPREVVESMLDIMPSRGLVQHEWSAHGTCSGMSPAAYFADLRRFAAQVVVPPELQQPIRKIERNAVALKADFLRANPTMRAEQLALLCDGRFLRELRVCLSKQGEPQACGGGTRDRCPSGTIIVRPVR